MSFAQCDRRPGSTHLPAILAAVVLPACLFGYIDTAWIRVYNGPGGMNDVINALALDDSGNIYGAGYTQFEGQYNYQFLTMRYRPDGETAWVRMHGGSPTTNNEAIAVGIDPAGNVYSSGFINGGASPAGDWGTIKYGPSGDSLWAVSVHRGNGARPNSQAVDDSGNVYVTGQVGNGVYLDYATAKYRTDSLREWFVTFSGGIVNPTDEAEAVAVDRRHNVYVTGILSSDATSTDFGTVKYSPLGETLWVARYDGPGSGPDGAAAMVLDSAGNVYVAGACTGLAGDEDFATVKYDSLGNRFWVARYDGPAHHDDLATAIALDGQGDLFVVGSSQIESGLGKQDFLTIRYNAVTGETVWTRRYDGPGHKDDVPVAVATDTGGNVYLTGASEGESTLTDWATLKYDRSGGLQWVMRLDGTAHSVDQPHALAVDAQANVYVAGEVYDIATLVDAALVKYTQTLSIEERPQPAAGGRPPSATVVRDAGRLADICRAQAGSGRVLDINGRTVAEFGTCASRFGPLAPGVYFLCQTQEIGARKVVLLAR